MPTPNATTPTPPRPGTPLTVLVDPEFARDLGVLMQTGMTAAEAIGEAVNILVDPREVDRISTLPAQAADCQTQPLQ
ncbi:hypothetical protein H9Y04_45425 [Streptomyces sp. TRM66268-LWL]|uniref:Uncharacterized protein n=1 Tax=Streptomyces polyasparticus TaxID=2767826 RepID=A0ABR7SW55_9ACTN|nr:hypothetical protein [Streptomyces polyasparticus]MBC9719720.1 hypothetical protein [Streptomyces polyasparticus]